MPDLLGRDFTAEAPNRVYVGDITYLPLADGGNLYLATVIDCCSRHLMGPVGLGCARLGSGSGQRVSTPDLRASSSTVRPCARWS
ncbi:hypothetical protein GCM10010472_28670 [Pseudonocardia halophobica]|uniref:Integrase catalytic domain-containing protein n=1 Tax=Pseudonocardia halophobica TaxID=29401 RepID=A0A9W6KYY6_9PSEU|nr:hypothetical protein GCM10017577_02660 [Pseudonocardia halophobica]